MTNNLLFENGIVYRIENDNKRVVFAQELFDDDNFNSLNLEFSIISLDGIVLFQFADEKIFLNVGVKRDDKIILLRKIDDKLLDYVVIGRTIFFINFDLEYFYNIISEAQINDLDNPLTYSTYLKLKKDLINSHFEIIDFVSDAIENLKISPNDVAAVEVKAKLFEYQKIGLNWLSFMYRNNCGSILADEMGLGKTLQVIALMTYIKTIEKNSQFLVVCPVSLLENWKRELNKFAPSMSYLVHHGSRRTGSYKELNNYDVIITSYSNVQSDLGMFNMIKWNLVVIDEAQNIKNPTAQRTKYIKQLNRINCVAVTGTPFENHVEDVWSIVDFVLPNYLGSLGDFTRLYADDIDSALQLESLLKPIMIRRKVDEVAKDLPDRVDIPQPILMDENEAQLYEDERSSVFDLETLRIDKIQGLRMFCTHPSVYGSLVGNDPIECSSKYQRLCEIVEEIISLDEKVIIFTSFNKMNDLLVTDLSKRFGINTYSITGSTEVGMRQKIIDSFSSESHSSALILNPKAAGSGLNITAANHVIHYNLEWNPAVEDQASARAYRRGQNKTVFIHRLYYVGTIEEVINDRIERKREISDTMIIGNQGETDKKDLIRAMSLSPIGRD